MIYVYVRHSVKDYATWRQGFDKHGATRQAAGATDEVYVMQNVEDPNDLTQRQSRGRKSGCLRCSARHPLGLTRWRW